MSYAHHFNPARTPQTEAASPLQVPNSAGGYSFQVDCWKRLERFLIMGAEGGSYYATERKLTRQNAQALIECLQVDHERAIRTIVEISDSNRAVKNDPCIFALAIAASHSSEKTRAAAYAAIPRVCRIGTHIFQFVANVDQFRGWGRGLRRAVANWYTSKAPQQVAFQVAKYGQRDGWSHADLLALCHARSTTHAAVFRYITTGIAGGGDRLIYNKRTGLTREYPPPGDLPEFLHGFEELKTANERQAIRLIGEHRFTHEMVPSELKNSPDVWAALLPHMPPTAIIRNLGKMTSVGLLRPLSAATALVSDRLQDSERLRDAHVHPMQVLSALRVYRQGHGDKGALKWVPVSQIVDGLDAGFYAAFGAIEPSNKRTLLALDVSASMTWAASSIPSLKITAREASACMAMVTARTESQWQVMGFSDRMRDIPISPRQRLDDVVSTIERIPAGGTDCSLPMQHALQEKLGVDTFVVYTDSETYAGSEHPQQALRRYRQATGIPARSAVVGMVSNEFTIADPTDAGMLDVVGFDTNAPALLASFARGEL